MLYEADFGEFIWCFVEKRLITRQNFKMLKKTKKFLVNMQTIRLLVKRLKKDKKRRRELCY